MPLEHVTTPPESPTQRAARGKAIRTRIARSSHAEFAPSATRRDPIDILEEQARTRVPDLVPIRYGRMLVSPFAFYRGAAAVMAADLAGLPHTGLRTQLCGDAHLGNFGGFAAPDRRLVFSINDFDETLPGPFEWDVKRLLASVAVAGRELGLRTKDRASIAVTVGRSYRDAMWRFATMRNLELWYYRMDLEQMIARWRAVGTHKQIQRLERNIAKARTKDSVRALSKLTALVDGERRFIADPPLIVPIEDLVGDEKHPLEDTLRALLDAYRRSLSSERRRLLERFRYVHAARKVVGVGSVGTRAWLLLMLGRDDDDPLVLQFKQAEASVLEPYLGKSVLGNHGHRVVEGQRLCQAASDILLGWIRVATATGESRDLYVRQLWDEKASANIDTMAASALEEYAIACAAELARAHARAGDAIAIAAYLGAKDVFDRSLATFAEDYANQNERDYRALQDAVAAGRIEATMGL
jgi:uncharacterized protein (DUF2252 family)